MYFITTKRMLEVCFFQHTPTFIIEPKKDNRCCFLDYHKKTTPVIKTIFNSIYGCSAYLIPNIFEFIHHMFMILKYFNLVEELCEPIRSLKSIQN